MTERTFPNLRNLEAVQEILLALLDEFLLLFDHNDSDATEAQHD